MAETFKFTIITPDGEFYDKQVDRIVIYTTEGVMGILHDHAPTTVALSSGPIEIVREGKVLKGVVHGGFAEIKENQVILLPDAAEWPAEIDIERAQKAKERALKILESRHIDEIDEATLQDAQAAHARAITRIDVAEWVDKN